MSIAGNKIKQYRAENDLTLEEFGKKVGVGKSTVRKWECGDVDNIRRSKLIEIAKVLGVSPIELIGWEETPTESDKYQISYEQIKESAIDKAESEGNTQRADRIRRLSAYNDGKLDLTLFGENNTPIFFETIPKYNELNSNYRAQLAMIVKETIDKLLDQQRLEEEIAEKQALLEKMREGN